MIRLNVAETIDEDIASCSPEIQGVLKQVRTTIARAAPEAGETIKYGIPTFVPNGNLVHFGAFKRHGGFYPTSSGIEAFKGELAAYEGARGSVRLPFDKLMPLRLIRRIIRFRAKEAKAKATATRRRR